MGRPCAIICHGVAWRGAERGRGSREGFRAGRLGLSAQAIRPVRGDSIAAQAAADVVVGERRMSQHSANRARRVSRRLCHVAVVCAWLASAAVVTEAQFSDVSATMSFEGVVNSIVAWVNDKQAATTPTGLSTWDNSASTTGETDSVAIFRLVANVDVTLTATARGLLSQTIGAQTAVLATYYQLDSDGDGSTATGFLGTEAGGGVGSVFYVGGGSSGYETLK